MGYPLGKNGEKFYFRVFLSLFAIAYNMSVMTFSMSLINCDFFTMICLYLVSSFCSLDSYLPFLNSPSHLRPCVST